MQSRQTAEGQMNNAIVRMRAKFVESVDQRILILEAGRSQAALAADPYAALQMTQRCLHSIAGLAPSLGFSTLGAMAARLDAEITSLAERHPAVDVIRQIDDGVEHFLIRLEALLD